MAKTIVKAVKIVSKILYTKISFSFLGINILKIKVPSPAPIVNIAMTIVFNNPYNI